MAASVGAWLYLVVFGSIVALTAYGYLLRHARPAVATSYAYVNPLVAVALGMGFAGDRLSVHALLGGAVVLSAVGALSWRRAPGKRRSRKRRVGVLSSTPTKTRERAPRASHECAYR